MALKRSIVVPVSIDSPDTNIEEDLRLMTLTSQIAKVVEDCKLDKLFPQIVDKLDSKQLALPKKSTTHALVYRIHSILNAFDKRFLYCKVVFSAI